ncbi:hypothetical protein DV737_g2380, partial [Chaetothyriales sp. CBS 132003]
MFTVGTETAEKISLAENGHPVEKTKVSADGKAEAAVSTVSTISTAPAVWTKRPRPATSWTRWLISNTARLAIWYALLTTLLRCPSDPAQLDASAPQICKPYLALRSHVQPHVQPYYDTYASAYVEKARPYVDQANARVVAPATAIAKKNFDTYAAPHLDTAHAYAHHQWEKALLPQLVRAQAQAAGLYHAHVAPHVSQASEAAQPYYTAAREAADKVHKQHLLPAYLASRPYLDSAANSSHHFVFHQASPRLRDGWTSAQIYVDGTLWPLVKGLYIDNVRPQLVMISERIATYQESRKLRAVTNDDGANAQVAGSDAAVQPPTASSSRSALDDLLALGEDESSASSGSSTAPSASVKPQAREVEYVTDESTTEDLRQWQEKFALAADRGTDDLKERVSEIASSLVQSDIDGLGKSLASALELTTARETDSIKAKIKSVVASLSDDASADEVANAEADIVKAVRASGLAVKEKAVNVREWAKKFEAQLSQRISAASTTTLEVLDGIRDLGLQEIGMRWAWSEGVTYKHWAKYHELRKTLDAWRREVYESALENEDAVAAKAAALQLLEESMAHTEEFAKQLVQLREAAKWKIGARDDSDDFEAREIAPAASSAAASGLAAGIQAASASSSAEPAASESALADEAPDSTEAFLSSAPSLADDAADSASSALDEAASEVSAHATPEASEHATSEASEYATTEASEHATTEASEHATSEPSEHATSESSEHATSEPSEHATSEPSGHATSEPSEHAPTEASDVPATEPSPPTGSGSKKASSFIPGAQAQEVKGSAPILDDHFDDSSEATFSQKVQSLVEDTGDRYAEVTRAASEALFGAQPGAGDSVTSVAGEQYSSALAAASAVLFGTAQGTAESVDASAQYAKAVAAASHAVYGAPTATLESLVNHASSSYSDAISQAQQHYEDAKSIASAQISGTTKPIHEEIFSSIETAFAGAQAAASSRLQAAVSAASAHYSAASSQVLPTQGPLEFISSVASSHLQAALQQASAHYSNVKSAVGAVPTPGGDEYLVAAQQKYYAALDYAHAQYSDFVSVASDAVHETLGPAYSSASSAASETWESLIAAASDKVYGNPTPALEEHPAQAIHQTEVKAPVVTSAAADSSSESATSISTEESDSADSSSESATSISTEESDSADSNSESATSISTEESDSADSSSESATSISTEESHSADSSNESATSISTEESDSADSNSESATSISTEESGNAESAAASVDEIVSAAGGSAAEHSKDEL